MMGTGMKKFWRRLIGRNSWFKQSYVGPEIIGVIDNVGNTKNSPENNGSGLDGSDDPSQAISPG